MPILIPWKNSDIPIRFWLIVPSLIEMTAGPKIAVTNCDLAMTEALLNDDDGLVCRFSRWRDEWQTGKIYWPPTTANIVNISFIFNK